MNTERIYDQAQAVHRTAEGFSRHTKRLEQLKKDLQQELELMNLQQEQEEEKLRGRHIIEQIEIKVRLAALSGERSLEVMLLEPKDYSPKTVLEAGDLRPEQLRGTGLLVYNFCHDQGLEPKIEYWYFLGLGQIPESHGFKLLVKW